MSEHREHEVIPSARRLIRSLRDMGYDFASAIADIVDNSIEAGATLVAIDIEFEGDNSWVRIADNGKGMTPTQLKEAMRYGADREYDEEDLGKFGLGLKTASLSQCQRLSVASRTNPSKADITAYCWDLAHIEKTNRWEILILERKGLGPAIHEPLRETTGTVVLWERLDRILGYKLPYGESARKRLFGICRDVEKHLSMVFHRFLAGEVPKKLKILLNGNDIKPWDPFARSEHKTRVLTPVTLKLDHEGIPAIVKLSPFVLPHQEDFSSPEAFKQASGPANWNQQQGFYIYRAGRLIQSGGWCKLRTADEHTKLARIALGFSPALDEAFKINVAKMRVQLPQQIREQIEQALKPVIKIAQDTYRRNSSRTPASQSVVAPGEQPTTSTFSDGPSVTPEALGQEGPRKAGAELLSILDELHSLLEKVAEPDERPIISKVFNRLRAMIKRKGKGDI